LKMIEEKLPPHDIEAEEAVIGSLIVDPDAIFKIATFLVPEDFFDETNQVIYQACLSVHQRNEVVNQITVAHELMRQNRLEQIGGAAYLSHLLSITPTPLYVEHYARIVSNAAAMRRLIVAAGQIAAIGYAAGADVESTLNKAIDILFQVGGKGAPTNLILVRDILSKYFEEVGQPSLEEKQIPHILTGFAGLDGLLGGLQRSDLVILAARPAVGKTSLALNIARNAAIEQKACVALFSLEMSRDTIVQRLLSSEARVDSKDVRLGHFTEREERRIMDASGVLSEAPIYIDDSPQQRVVDIGSKARRLHRERNIDLIVIDYLQLMRGDGKNEPRVQEIGNITRSLKGLARELNVPVLTVSQLSRAVEWRSSHKPQLFDLRESGSIEQDADVVFFIHRESMYCEEEEWYRTHDVEKEPYPRNEADILVEKHRNGPVGMVKLRFLPWFSRFDNVEVVPAPSSEELL
jgi:replicative DNA helicase